MAPFEALYGNRCRSLVGWFEVGEETLVRKNSVYEVMDKVQLFRDTPKTTLSCQKSYANVRRRELEFHIDDWVI